MSDIVLRGPTGESTVYHGVDKISLHGEDGQSVVFGESSNNMASLVDGSIQSISAEDLSGITQVRNSAFARCFDLTQCILPEGVSRIGMYAFSLTGIKTLDLPSSVLSIGSCAFEWTDMRTLICRAVTPPSLSSDAFQSASTVNLKIYVPAESVSAYKSASGWSDFSSQIYALS